MPILLGSTVLGGLAVVAVVVASGTFVLFVAPEPPRASREARGWTGAATAMRARALVIFSDIKRTLTSRAGFTGVIFCVAPVGCGALVNLDSALADAYHGPAVATKYSLFVTLSNQAIGYVTYLDGLASTFHDAGAVGTVVFDGLITLVGIAIVGAMTLVTSSARARAFRRSLPSDGAPR